MIIIAIEMMRVKEKYRISCAPGYVVGEDDVIYRLPYIDTIGRPRVTQRVSMYNAGPNNCLSCELNINGKIKRFSKTKLSKYYVEVPEKNKRWIVLPYDHEEGLLGQNENAVQCL